MVQSRPIASVERLQETHVPQVQALLNAHLGNLVPGWAIPADFIAHSLSHHAAYYRHGYLVQDHLLLCALVNKRVIAAAHLLHYANIAGASERYRNAGDIAWFLAWSDAGTAAASLLFAAHSQMSAWGVTREYAWDAGLPVGPFNGVPEAWPHIAEALAEGGYRCQAEGRYESVYGGFIDKILLTDMPSFSGLTVQRSVGTGASSRFAAFIDGKEIGSCEYITDLTLGGMLPALRGWGVLSDLSVDEVWQHQGIELWLVQQAIAWHHLSDGKRLLIRIEDEEESALQDLYRRPDWQRLARQGSIWTFPRPETEEVT